MRSHAPFGLLLGVLMAGLMALPLAAPAAPAGPAQDPPATDTTAAEADSETPTFGVGTAQVVLDVVVRDKKGRPILDIKPEEVEVYEEGTRQEIEGFKLVESGEIEEEKQAPTLTRPDAARRINLVTIVFDALGVDGRRLARRAAEAFVDKGLKPNTYISIFRVDQRLAMVAPFSNDKKLLEQAIDRATSGERFGVTDEREALEAALQQMRQGAEVGGEGGQAPDTAGVGAAAAAQAQARALANMLRLANELQAQQQGGTSLYPLLALAKGQRDLAGRKTMIYITEWLGVPPTLEAVFRSVISEANRSNVSIYAVDARGLTTDQAMAGARDMLTRARDASMDIVESRGSGSWSKEEIKLSETAEGALRANVEGILQDLAEGTGGFHIANTNNFKPGAERIAADIAGYYELSYTPPPFEFDGAFRAIEVRVARKDATVHTRNGYFALPPGKDSAVFPYEVPLLGALSVDNPPKDFQLRAGALKFGDSPQGGRDTKIVVEVPISDLEMTTDEVNLKYNLHLSLLAAVKDKDGAIVQRYSEDYPFEGPLEKAEALKLGNIVFKRRLALSPGQYSLEVAGQDRETGKISVSRDAFLVPKPHPGPEMSSLALVRRVDDLPQGTESDDPLDLFNKKRIVPNLDAPISRAANPKLWLFFMAYPENGASQPPQMTLEFAREGKTIGQSQALLPAPDPDGVIRFIGPIPTDNFSEGTYDLKVALSQGDGTCAEETEFTLVP
jgi:VWFA-related protein